MYGTRSATSFSRSSGWAMPPSLAHRDAVVDADGVELEGDAAGGADRLLDRSADLLEVGVAGDDVDVAVDDRDERLAEVALVLDHAGRAQERPVGRFLEAALDDVGTHRPLVWDRHVVGSQAGVQAV
jgi:hypothetical protein